MLKNSDVSNTKGIQTNKEIEVQKALSIILPFKIIFLCKETVNTQFHFICMKKMPPSLLPISNSARLYFSLTRCFFNVHLTFITPFCYTCALMYEMFFVCSTTLNKNSSCSLIFLPIMLSFFVISIKFGV